MLSIRFYHFSYPYYKNPVSIAVFLTFWHTVLCLVFSSPYMMLINLREMNINIHGLDLPLATAPDMVSLFKITKNRRCHQDVNGLRNIFDFMLCLGVIVFCLYHEHHYNVRIYTYYIVFKVNPTKRKHDLLHDS